MCKIKPTELLSSNLADYFWKRGSISYSRSYLLQFKFSGLLSKVLVPLKDLILLTMKFSWLGSSIYSHYFYLIYKLIKLLVLSIYSVSFALFIFPIIWYVLSYNPSTLNPYIFASHSSVLDNFFHPKSPSRSLIIINLKYL